MARRNKVFRSALAVRRGKDDELKFIPCRHYHGSVQVALTCLAVRIRAALSDGLVELHGVIEYTHSRHDWFRA